MLNIALLEEKINMAGHLLWGWPMVIFILCAGIIFTFAFNWLQVRYFITGWKLLFAKDDNAEKTAHSISSFQAFINALSASLGNGGLGGMATVLVAGGPGTMFWVFILGFVTMILRFAEVYAGTLIKGKTAHEHGGPLTYIRKLPAGSFFAYIYALFMLIFIFVGGNMMQCNTMGLSLQKITGWPFWIIGIIFSFVVLYITYGGAKRIMKASQAIIPIKVGLFFFSIFAVIIYNAQHIPAALKLIIGCAFNIPALAGGAIAFTIQQAMCVGFARGLNATEAGLGTAAIFFGSTETKKPLKSAIMSIITAFISTNLVCCMIILSLVATGVWNNGLTSAPLVISAFATTFGTWAGPLVTFLSFSFGLGVLVAYSFLGEKMWQFLFGKTSHLYAILFAITAFAGTLGTVNLIWTSIDIIVAVLFIINVSALLWVLPELRAAFLKDEKSFNKE